MHKKTPPWVWVLGTLVVLAIMGRRRHKRHEVVESLNPGYMTKQQEIQAKLGSRQYLRRATQDLMKRSFQNGEIMSNSSEFLTGSSWNRTLTSAEPQLY